MDFIETLNQDCATPSPHMLLLLDELSARSGRPRRWMPSRLILQRYWLFEYQEFAFLDGRLNLRGANQSGKSIVLASALPVVLDGITRPESLDPFGSRNRSVEYLLLGGEEQGPAFSREEGNAIVALEFRHGATGEFLTIGVALRATPRRAGTEFRGFLLRDGRRIGHGFALSTSGDALTFAELEAALAPGHGNGFVRTPSEYQDLLNDALFGFADTGQLRDLVKTLLQLRSPKLNGRILLKEVQRALVESLPPVGDDILNQVSDTIIRISGMREEVERTRTRIRHATHLDDVYGSFLCARAREAALQVLNDDRTLATARQEKEGIAADIRILEEEFGQAERLEASLHREDTEVGARLAVLASDPEVLRQHELIHSGERIGSAEETVKREQERRYTLERRAADREREAREAEEMWKRSAHDMVRAIRQLASEAQEAQWLLAREWIGTAQAAAEAAELDTERWNSVQIPTHALVTESQRRTSLFDALIEALSRKSDADTARMAAHSALDLARREREAAERNEAAARQGVMEAQESVAAEIGSILEIADTHIFGEEARAESLARVRAYTGSGDVANIVEPLCASAEAAAVRLTSDGEMSRERRGALREKRAALQAERDAVALRTWSPSLHPAEGDRAKEALAREGVACVPLFLACELRPDIDPVLAIRLELGLQETGLLDALIVPGAAWDITERVLRAGGLQGSWIRGDPQVEEKTLADFLIPVEGGGVAAGDVIAGLKCVAVSRESDASTWIDGTGGWRIGALDGRTASSDQSFPRFLGAENRERARRATLDEVEVRIREVDDQIERAERELTALHTAAQRARSLAVRLRALPELSMLAEAGEARVRADEAASTRRADEALRDRLATSAQREYQTARKAVSEAAHAVPEAEGLDQDAVAELRRVTHRLCDHAEGVATKLTWLLELARSDVRVRVALQEARDDLATCEDALRSAHERLEAERAILAAARARLEENATGHSEPVAEFARLTGRQRNVREQLETAQKAGSRSSERVSQRRRELEAKEERIQELESNFRSAARELEERVSSDRHSALTEVADQIHSDGASAAAATLLADLRGAPADQRASVRGAVDEAQARLVDAVGAVRGPLGEYIPEFDYGAYLVRVRAPSALLTPTQLLARMRQHEEHQARVLNDDERRLFEDFFLGTLAQRLRERIDTAQALVRGVNVVLEKRPISAQGEIVQLHWKAIREDPKHVGEPYYTKLVELLGANFSFFPEAGKTVVELFRSEVERLLEEDRTDDAEEDFRSALRRAMDYREWFAFTLVVRQPGGKPTELTHRHFGQRSGAGRALVILLPLVAAVDVLLSDARPDAPKFIGLDEAFAGVDSDNIDRMFAVLVDLDFSWIMTNQDLWGVSPAVPGCTTYELILRGSVVAPVLFVWNGHQSIGMLGRTLAPVTDSDGDGGPPLASA
ncbi:MAG TPA: TIGR02680 family protein [Longimicrobium sp.]|jgi:uncharacterized protein (TIGR02680 family)